MGIQVKTTALYLWKPTAGGPNRRWPGDRGNQMLSSRSGRFSWVGTSGSGLLGRSRTLDPL